MTDKDVEISSADSVAITDADEALELVGLRREAQFSEEYYAKLRRKLVSSAEPEDCQDLMSRNVTGLDYSSSLRGCLFHTVFVSQRILVIMKKTS